MCGIIGYIGENDIKNTLLSGLKELEYRGYDSAGLAILDEKLDLAIFKSAGKLVNLETKTSSYKSPKSGLGIAHTRWATHGKPTEINAHPHAGAHTTIVHNGIIENYAEIKCELEAKGCVFTSQTDSEIIVHLFEDYLKQGLDPDSAFAKTINSLKGAFAILLITTKKPSGIFYAKHGAPLIIGKSNSGEIHIASSNAPLIGLSSEVVYLEDGRFGFIDKSNFGEFKNKKTLDLTQESAQKDGFEFFMEKEIYEQKDVLMNSILGRINLDSNKISLDINIPDIRSITICACGTSYHAGLVGKYLLERIAGIKTEVIIASEYRYGEFVTNADELFIGISQSGETADTLEAMKIAKANGAKTLSICNVDESSLTRLSDSYILTRAGIEKGVASTKAFATQVLVLWIFALDLGLKFGRNINKQQEIKNIFEAINATEVSLDLHERIKRLSKRYLHGHGFFFIGRDIFYPLALEGALKLKELSYLHAEGYASGEMKHGPIALVDSNLFTIALLPRHKLFDKMLNNIQELSARDATICVISSAECNIADDLIKIPSFSNYMSEFFAMMVALQLLSLEIARKIGNDIDMPRNLAKSVTVE
ncbi:MAG: glutamine--fructose-6-phosphate transaminase (isomerizing) [Helicobacter sp.]|nr:glutamine--fructose-6-phosphate transaminase (isomerizing) [Helicobacter sp.]